MQGESRRRESRRAGRRRALGASLSHHPPPRKKAGAVPAWSDGAPSRPAGCNVSGTRTSSFVNRPSSRSVAGGFLPCGAKLDSARRAETGQRTGAMVRHKHRPCAAARRNRSLARRTWRMARARAICGWRDHESSRCGKPARPRGPPAKRTHPAQQHGRAGGRRMSDEVAANAAAELRRRVRF